MKFKMFALFCLCGLLLAGPVMARPKHEARQELSRQERKHIRKHVMHKQMARQHGRKMMHHKMMAREHGMQFRNKNFGPMMHPEHRMGPPQHLRKRDGFHKSRAL